MRKILVQFFCMALLAVCINLTLAQSSYRIEKIEAIESGTSTTVYRTIVNYNDGSRDDYKFVSAGIEQAKAYVESESGRVISGERLPTYPAPEKPPKQEPEPKPQEPKPEPKPPSPKPCNPRLMQCPEPYNVVDLSL